MNEFERIAQYLAPLSAGYAGAFGLKDDVALLDDTLIVTTDTIVEGVHYIGDEPADLVAKKLLRCNLSDLSAKGAKPLYYTLNLTLTPRQDDNWLAKFAEGLKQDQGLYGITLIGGDSTMTKEGPCVLSATAFGKLETGVDLPKRSGAKAGDVVCISGTIGDAAIGLKLLKNELAIDNIKAMAYLIRCYHLPEPRVELGQKLAPYMHASLDISDGLMQDAGHIAAYSDVHLALYADKLPLSPAVQSLLDTGQITIEDIVASGDDYEILCSMDKSGTALFGDDITIIGEVTKGSGVSLLDANNSSISLNKSGYKH